MTFVFKYNNGSVRTNSGFVKKIIGLIEYKIEQKVAGPSFSIDDLTFYEETRKLEKTKQKQKKFTTS